MDIDRMTRTNALHGLGRTDGLHPGSLCEGAAVPSAPLRARVRKGYPMGTSDGPAATIHPGAVRAIFDHLLLSLTVDGEPGPAAFVFSHYRFRWAADGIVGDLAFAELERGGGPERIVLTSEPALAVGQAGRLSPRGWAATDAERAPMIATFSGTPLASDSVGETVIS